MSLPNGTPRRLLELRLSQLEKIDPTLQKYVQKAVDDLTDPAAPVIWARNIAARALDLIWEKELPPDRVLPIEWINEWKFALTNLPDEQGRLPLRRGAQCNVLRLITGTEKTRRVAHFITKPTYILVDHLQSIGDFGQHKEDDVTSTFAAAVCYSAIELCESLSKDLNKRI